MEEVPESINSKSKNNNKNYDISYWDPPSRLRHGRGTGIYK
ncbi:hypothetical protein T11_11752 [Trichinella zimbabwensis]|uniref:Uncharacterized protein n=1 Tax=Trichinella zimbabwensis TaxID=268475 RepID=A0A0V1G881_9BILA|nr:hypothetical protein T11_11752 [Trichinella zimbabwensis]